MKKLITLGLASLFLFATARADQRDDDRRDDDRRREGPRVILFQNADFRGGAFVLYPGESIENMSGATFDNGAKLNDSITSIRIEGDVEVFAYENARYRGDALRLTESARDLTGRPVAGGISVSWNDRISSIKVAWIKGRERDDRGPGRPREDRPRDDRLRGDPEKIIKDTFKELLGREPDSGELRDFRDRIKDQGWNERMLRDHLRTEDRYRREAADLIVRRAYREILGREVDPSGLKHYSRNLLEKDWTESDIRDDLRKSDEYRNKPRK
jgi:hypothetical protein